MFVAMLALVVLVLVVVSFASMRTYVALARRSPDSDVLKHFTMLLRYILLALVAVSATLVGCGTDSIVLIERVSEKAEALP